MISCEWTLLGQSDIWDPRYYFSLVQHGPKIYLYGGKNLGNFAFNSTHSWKFRAADTRPKSTYIADFTALLRSASQQKDDPGVVELKLTGSTNDDSKKEPLYAHW